MKRKTDIFRTEDTSFYVEGRLYDHPDSDLAPDGTFAPFYVFDVAGQCHRAGPFDTLEAAWAALTHQWAGVAD